MTEIQNPSLFRDLVANERSFDSLFCKHLELKEGIYFYNEVFSEDPIFNHFTIRDDLMEVSADAVRNGDLSQRMESLLLDLREVKKDLGLPVGVFVDEFWASASMIQKYLVEVGYRVGQRMEIFHKKITGSQNSSEDVSVSVTKDVDSWNKVFMEAFQAQQWRPELDRILREVLQDKEKSRRTSLVIAQERKDENPSGCLLLVRYPLSLMGVYCVGTIPSRRGRGIARAMLFTAEGIARDQGCDSMTLQTMVSDNVSPMYLKMDYKLIFARNIFVSS